MAPNRPVGGARRRDHLSASFRACAVWRRRQMPQDYAVRSVTASTGRIAGRYKGGDAFQWQGANLAWFVDHRQQARHHAELVSVFQSSKHLASPIDRCKLVGQGRYMGTVNVFGRDYTARTVADRSSRRHPPPASFANQDWRRRELWLRRTYRSRCRTRPPVAHPDGAVAGRDRCR
jgi:hypothetical protein